MAGYEQKSLDKPDERRDFPKGHVDVVQLAGHSIGRTYLEPGWKWSESVKPVVGTELCEVPHVGYLLSGRIAVRMADGTELEIGAGDSYSLSDPHDAWVVGQEPAQGVEFESLKDYARAT
jgi:hypothetical protein